MKIGTHIQTPEGLQYYHNTHNQYLRMKADGLLEMFNEMMVTELKRSDDLLEQFLEDDDLARKYKMNDEDVEGWQAFKVMADQNAALRFFTKVAAYEVKQ